MDLSKKASEHVPLAIKVRRASYLCTASHDVEKQNTAEDSLITVPIVLEKKSWVGSRAFISLGVRIGENAIVGAMASVYKSVSVEANTIVGENPAKVLKKKIMQ